MTTSTSSEVAAYPSSAWDDGLLGSRMRRLIPGYVHPYADLAAVSQYFAHDVVSLTGLYHGDVSADHRDAVHVAAGGLLMTLHDCDRADVFCHNLEALARMVRRLEPQAFATMVQRAWPIPFEDKPGFWWSGQWYLVHAAAQRALSGDISLAVTPQELCQTYMLQQEIVRHRTRTGCVSHEVFMFSDAAMIEFATRSVSPDRRAPSNT